MSNFTIVPEDEFPSDGSRGKYPSALSLALEAGHVVFVEGKAPRALANKSAYLRKRGFYISQRVGQRNGVTGYYVRAHKNGAA